jgi:hypothetical protein
VRDRNPEHDRDGGIGHCLSSQELHERQRPL